MIVGEGAPLFLFVAHSDTVHQGNEKVTTTTTAKFCVPFFFSFGSQQFFVFLSMIFILFFDISFIILKIFFIYCSIYLLGLEFPAFRRCCQ